MAGPFWSLESFGSDQDSGKAREKPSRAGFKDKGTAGSWYWRWPLPDWQGQSRPWGARGRRRLAATVQQPARLEPDKA